MDYYIQLLLYAIGSAGVGRLYLYLIQPGQLFGFMQRVLTRYKDSNVFLFKSLGGCNVCTRQRFTEFAFIAFILFSPRCWYLSLYEVLHGTADFLVFTGVAFYANVIADRPANVETKTVKKQIELN